MLDRYVRSAYSDLGRAEILQSGGVFTVQQLLEVGLDPEAKDGRGRSRELHYLDDVVPVRLIPHNLLRDVQRIWDDEHDIGHVIEAMYTSFYVFRACVNKGFEVPLVRKDDGNWEWPEPSGFSWGDEQTKTLALMFGAYRKLKGAEIRVTQGDTTETLFLESGVVDRKKVAAFIAHPDEHLLFQIPKLEDVRMINQQAWQLHAIRSWAGYYGGLAQAFDELLAQKLDRPSVEEYFLSMIEQIDSTPIDFPVVRYAKEAEKGSMGNLFILEF